MHTLRSRGLILGFAALALIAGACGSSKKNSGSPTTTGNSPTTSTVKQGGDLTLSAEQEPDCMDWIGSCAGAAWGPWTVGGNTMPRAYDIGTDNTFKPSILLTGDATVVNSPQQKVTYHINPKAVWSDGQPITSTDFKYTWDQIAHGKNIYDQTGYKNIASVDDSDPHTAVVTFSQTFGDWKGLFGAYYGVLPSHILQGQDRAALMKDGYTFSGGPWKLDHWTKGTEIKVVPNPNYWGKKPNLNSVTWKVITDTSAEIQDFKSGQVLAAYPQAQPGEVALKGLPGTYFNATTSVEVEGLWFNVEKAPLNEKAVRQALGYATDRDAIVKQLFAPIQPDIQPIQSWLTPSHGKFYSTPFAKYKPDANMVNTLMTGAGWAKGADGIWAKGGVKAVFELKTTTNNQRRLLTAQIVQSEWKNAGFGLNLVPEKSSVLFGQDLPNGNFQIGLYAQNPSDPDPSQLGCNTWCSANIPTAANGGSGTNFDRINDPNLDKYFSDLDSNPDNNARIQDSIQGQAALAELMPALPIDPFPDIIAVNTDKIGVEGGTFQHNLVYGPFVYLNEWYAK